MSDVDLVTGLPAPTLARLHAAAEAAHLLAVARAWAAGGGDTVLWARAELAGLAVERVLRQLGRDQPRPTTAPLHEVHTALRCLDVVAECGAGDDLVERVDEALAAVHKLLAVMAAPR